MLHSDYHKEYEVRFGIPQMLAHADLSGVGWSFLHWLLTDKAVNPGISHPIVKAAVDQCADVVFALSKGAVWGGENAAQSAWSAARSAWSAAESAEESAAESAAWSAKSAAWSAASAAKSAERASCWSAAGSAGSAAKSAAESAAKSAAESAAESGGERAASLAYALMSEKLIELLMSAR